MLLFLQDVTLFDCTDPSDCVAHSELLKVVTILLQLLHSKTTRCELVVALNPVNHSCFFCLNAA